MAYNVSTYIQKTINMTGKKTLFVILVCCFAFTGVQAQKLNKAKRYMEQLNYIGAIELFNQILDTGVRDWIPLSHHRQQAIWRKVKPLEAQ